MRILLILAAIGLSIYFGLPAMMLSGSSPADGPLQATIIVDPSDSAGWEAQDFLTQRGVRVRVLDVRADATAHAEWVRLGRGTLPIILIEGKRLDGFQPWEAQRTLDRIAMERP